MLVLRLLRPQHVQKESKFPYDSMPTFFFPFDFFQGNVKPQKRRGKLERNWISTILFSNSPKYSNHCKKKKKEKRKERKKEQNYTNVT